MAFGLAAFLLATAAPIAKGQEQPGELTAKTLVANAVTEVGPHEADVDDAIAAFKQRKFDEARKLLEEAKKKTPKLAPPEIMLAALFASANMGPQARGELEKAVQNHPDDPEAYLAMADLALSDGRLTEAGLLYVKGTDVTDKFSENPLRKKNFQLRVHSGLAAINENHEKWAEARDHLRSLLTIDAENVAGHQRLGRVLFQLGEDKEAYKEFQAAAKIDKNAPPVDLTIASLYWQKKEKGKAEKFVQEAVKKGAKDFHAQLALAQWFLQTNQLKEAKNHVDEATKLDPKNLDAIMTHGVVARMTGDLKTAAADFEAVLNKSLYNPIATNQLALTLIDAGDEDSRRRALEHAESNYQRNAKNVDAVATLGWVYYRSGRKAQAQTAFNQIPGGPNLAPDLYYYLAFITHDEGRSEQAVPLLKAALGSDRPFAYRAQAQQLLTQLTKKSAKGADGAKQGAKAPAGKTPTTEKPAAGKKETAKESADSAANK